MRDIKFRAYIHRKMWDVIEWNFDGDYVDRQDLLLRNGEGNELRELLKNLDLMQYTGLKDRNGKEIYEGTILRSLEGEKTVIQWNERQAEFTDEYGNSLHLLLDSSYEAIGNMYENPELLHT
jgi:uncharacterized phage protein (TIGR01671 family)